MKNLKDIKEEIANVSSGLGVRGFGDVSGTPKIDGDDDGENPHIQRVIAGAIENNNQVKDYIDNQTSGLYSFKDLNWWAKPGAKGTALTGLGKPMNVKSIIKEGMEKDHYKAIDDVHVNLDNRNHAIEDYGYGPLNPNEESADFWKEKAKLWETSIEEAKKSRCGNCAAFNKSKEITNRIAQNLGPAGKKITEKADLGFCEMFHFKCAAARTCDAWLMNGPIMEENGGIANVTGAAVPGTGDTGEAFVSVAAQKQHRKRNEEGQGIMRRNVAQLQTGMFAGNKTFKVPTNIFEKARLEKAKGKHWRKYMDDQDFHPEIREYARTNPSSPIIFEDEKTGYMFYARYGKKRK